MRGTEEPLDENEREESKSWLKTQCSKNEDLGICPIILWQIDGETMETVTDFIFLGFKITADGDCSHEIRRYLLHYKKASGCDGIPVELFHILKDDAVKVLHSICQQIWKTQQWP